jgi:hypothetical protein
LSERGSHEPRRRKSAGRRRFDWRILPVAVVCLAFAALIVVRTIEVAGPNPMQEAAVRLESASVDDLPGIARDAKLTLADNPLDARAVSLLASVAERRGDSESATGLMRTAARLSHRSASVDSWLFSHAIATRQYDEAFLHADAIMRRRPDSLVSLFPPVLASVNHPAAIEPMARRLAFNPEWRTQFLTFAADRSPQTAFGLLSSLKKLGSPPTVEELSFYLNKLINEQRFAEALADWRVLRPSSAGDARLVSDGDFSAAEWIAPFGWDFEGNVVGNVEPADQHGRNEPALRIDYDGSARARFPQQLIVLAPGRYRLSGEALTANTESAGSLQWNVACVEGPILGSWRTIDTNLAWRRFSVDFDVPPEGCKAQWLVLKPNREDRRTTVEVWYDKLAISPLSSAAGMQQP